MTRVLDATTLTRLESEVGEMLKNDPDSAAAFRRWASWDAWAAIRAVALSRLGIEPSVAGLTWERLLNPPRLNRLVSWDARPYNVLWHYHPTDQATIDAKAFLRRSGLDILDADPKQDGALDMIGAWGDRVRPMEDDWNARKDGAT
jgi:hypothetical protein